jgi:hypothetical protein
VFYLGGGETLNPGGGALGQPRHADDVACARRTLSTKGSLANVANDGECRVHIQYIKRFFNDVFKRCAIEREQLEYVAVSILASLRAQ